METKQLKFPEMEKEAGGHTSLSQTVIDSIKSLHKNMAEVKLWPKKPIELYKCKFSEAEKMMIRDEVKIDDTYKAFIAKHPIPETDLYTKRSVIGVILALNLLYEVQEVWPLREEQFNEILQLYVQIPSIEITCYGSN